MGRHWTPGTLTSKMQGANNLAAEWTKSLPRSFKVCSLHYAHIAGETEVERARHAQGQVRAVASLDWGLRMGKQAPGSVKSPGDSNSNILGSTRLKLAHPTQESSSWGPIQCRCNHNAPPRYGEDHSLTLRWPLWLPSPPKLQDIAHAPFLVLESGIGQALKDLLSSRVWGRF